MEGHSSRLFTVNLHEQQSSNTHNLLDVMTSTMPSARSELVSEQAPITNAISQHDKL
jgi:hypothetical protein